MGTMNTVGRLAGSILAWGLIVTGCSPAPTIAPTPISSASAATTVVPSPSSTASTVRIDDTASGISFEAPADWARWRPNLHDWINDGPLIYLSTEALVPTCATVPPATPNPGNAQGRACEWPLGELDPGGVLVTWLTTRILQRLPTEGQPIEVNGDEARWQTASPGVCEAVKADETISVLVPMHQPTPLSNIAVLACLRGPDLAGSEAKVRAMVESATIAQ